MSKSKKTKQALAVISDSLTSLNIGICLKYPISVRF